MAEDPFKALREKLKKKKEEEEKQKKAKGPAKDPFGALREKLQQKKEEEERAQAKPPPQAAPPKPAPPAPQPGLPSRPAPHKGPGTGILEHRSHNTRFQVKKDITPLEPPRGFVKHKFALHDAKKVEQKQGGKVVIDREEVDPLPPPKGLVKHKFGLSDVSKMSKSKGRFEPRKPEGMDGHYKKKGKKSK